MAKKELKTEVKRLRLTELEAKQLEKYLNDHDLNFSEFVNALIGQKIMSEFPIVSAEPLDVTVDSKKSKSKTVRQPPKIDPVLLFQIGKIGNNLNQVARSLNLIQKDKKCEICGTSVAKINLSNRTRLIEFYICSKKGCEWNRLSKDYVIEIKIDDSLVCQFNKD